MVPSILPFQDPLHLLSLLPSELVPHGRLLHTAKFDFQLEMQSGSPGPQLLCADSETHFPQKSVKILLTAADSPVSVDQHPLFC